MTFVISKGRDRQTDRQTDSVLPELPLRYICDRVLYKYAAMVPKGEGGIFESSCTVLDRLLKSCWALSFQRAGRLSLIFSFYQCSVLSPSLIRYTTLRSGIRPLTRSVNNKAGFFLRCFLFRRHVDTFIRDKTAEARSCVRMFIWCQYLLWNFIRCWWFS
jgi:hypothetical protein